MQAIYALVDPRDMKEFYIGRTEDVYRRFREHLACTGRNDAKNQRIKELQSLHLVPIMKTLELVEDAALAGQREAYWIRHFRYLGHTLANDTTFNFLEEEEADTIEITSGPLIPIEQFKYHTTNGVRRRRTYVSFEEASQCTGYTVEELKVLARRQKIKMSYDREKLILTSLKAKPYFGTNILNRRKW